MKTRWRTSLVAVRVLLVLIGVMFVGQVFLMACNCSCKQDRKENYFPRSAANIFRTSECEKALKNALSKVESLQAELKMYKEKLERVEQLDKLIISEELSEHKTLDQKDILRSYLPRNEFHVIPYESFTANQLFGDIGYQSKRPVSYPVGQREVEHREILRFAIRTLNGDLESRADRVSTQNFAEGIVRNDRIHGTVYDMYFTSQIPDVFKRISVLRPFTNLQLAGKPETIDTSKEWINMVVPLAGKLDTLELFLRRFVDTCIRRDRRVFLTLVYFGDEGKDKVKSMITEMAKAEKYTHYHIVISGEEFSRGAGLQKGVNSWARGNVLLFFCDVDMYFTHDFLDRCRLHAAPGKKVYYPIVFSQYNPNIIYGGQPAPELHQQMYLHKDSGFWRDFGFGMTCQYKNDFMKTGGFNLKIRGWGGEDTDLYKRYLKGSLNVVRAYDRGLFHIYHTKSCSKTLTDNQFVSCLQSKAVSEGSHKQLGMLAFGSSLLTGKDPEWGRRLRESMSVISSDPKQNSQKQEEIHENKKLVSTVPVTGKDSTLNSVVSNSEVDSNLQKSNKFKAVVDQLSSILENMEHLHGKDVGIDDFDNYRNNLKILRIKFAQKSEELVLKRNQMIDGG